MKITTLLAQYLYTNKRLDLTGIGSFILDPAAITATEGNKHRSSVIEGISFISNPQQKESAELIAYVSAQSGKMKALSTSDIDSHLQLVQQFLNIGKPFTFDGIGTIVKLKDGSFDFIPGAVSSEKLKDMVHPDAIAKQAKEESNKNYQSFLSESKPTGSWRKPVIAILVLCGIGVAVWGGYVISRKKAPAAAVASTTENVPVKEETTTLVTDTSTLNKIAVTKPDTIAAAIPATDSITLPPATTEGNYKYILEVAQSKRAFQRYNQLRTNLWAVKLETTDSLQYKLYLLLPSFNADTTRVLDSLTVMTGRRVYIEHQN